MRNLTLLLLLICSVLCFAACSGASGPQPEDPAQPAVSPDVELPAPDSLIGSLKQASYTENDLIKLGRDYDPGFPHDNVNTNGSMVEFDGSGWMPGQGTDGLAYCMYGFAVPDYDRAAEINTEWSVEPSGEGTVFFALANWDTNRWDWYAGDSPLSLASFDPYFTDDKGDLLLVVASIDSTSPVLDLVQLGPPPSYGDWLHTWGGTEQDFGIGTASNGLDAVYVAGYCDSFGEGETDAVLARYSMEGTFQWARAWGGPDAEELRNVVVADDGQVYAVGQTYSYGVGGPDLLIQGWSENGFLTWTRVWGTPTGTYNTGLAISGSFLYIIGYTTLPAGDREAVVLKYDTGGNLLWSKSLGLEFDDYTGGIVVTKAPEQTDVVHVAFDLGVDSGEDDVGYCQIGGDGSMLLQKQWLYGDDDTFIQSLVVGDGGSPVFIAGYTNNADLGKEVFVLEYATEPGYLARSWTGDSTANTTCDRVIFDSVGNLVVAGGITGFGTGGGGLLATIATDGTLLGADVLGSSGGGVGFYNLGSAIPGRVLITGPADAAENCTWETPTLTMTDRSGTWADVTLNFATISGTTTPPTGSMVTDLAALGTHDSGGGDLDVLVGLIEAP
jgi:hypothetical protein